MSEVVWRSSAGSLSIHYRTVPTPSLERLLEATVWGSSDVKYMIRMIPDILAKISDPHYITLENDSGAVIGGIVCGRKKTVIADQECDAIHLAMIAIDPESIGLGYGPLLGKHAKQFLLELLGGTGVIYLFVEATHTESLKLHRFLGYRDLCSVQTRVFARLFPRERTTIRRLRANEKRTMVERLDEQYSGHVLTDFAESIKLDEYYVLNDAEEIIAGVQGSAMHWSLVKLEGLGGFIALKILPRMPILRKGYDPSDLQFLRLGSLFAKTGHEKSLTVLLEALLAKHHLNVGMLFFDERSEIHRKLEANIKFGVATSLVKVCANILVEFKGFGSKEVEWFRSRPFHLSPMDTL